MNSRALSIWFQVISIILAGFGIVYVFFGLQFFSTTIRLIPPATLLPWESALYGAIMLGWALTLLLVGRIAIRRKDNELKRALLAGIATWLLVEATASAVLGVWFNVGVDVVVCALLIVPLLLKPRT